MDTWQVVLTSVLSSGVVAALVSGGVSIYTSKKDREHLNKRLEDVDLPLVALQQERWEHEKTADERQRAQKAVDDLQAVLSDMTAYINVGVEDDPDEWKSTNQLLHRASVVMQEVKVYGDPSVLYFGQSAVRAFDDLTVARRINHPATEDFFDAFIQRQEILTDIVKTVTQKR
jgi:hypothetical protein